MSEYFLKYWFIINKSAIGPFFHKHLVSVDVQIACFLFFFLFFWTGLLFPSGSCSIWTLSASSVSADASGTESSWMPWSGWHAGQNPQIKKSSQGSPARAVPSVLFFTFAGNKDMKAEQRLAGEAFERHDKTPRCDSANVSAGWE